MNLSQCVILMVAKCRYGVMNRRASQKGSRQLYPFITDANADDWRGGSGPTKRIAARSALFNYLVGGGNERLWNC